MKKQFKKILALVFVILFITLTPLMSYINIESNVYAEPIVLTGLGIKVVATILASMGVLSFVKTNIGMDEFYQGLLEFAENVKEILDFQQMLIDIAVQGIILSAKMKITSVKDCIIEYYNTIRSDIIAENEELIPSPLEAPIALIQKYTQNSVGTILGKGLVWKTIDTVNIGEGYTLELRGRRKSSYTIEALIKFGSTILKTVTSNFRSETDVQDGDIIIFKCTTAFDNETLTLLVNILNKSSNEVATGIESTLFTLEAFEFLETIDTNINTNIPIAKSIPLNLTFPWDLDINTEDVIGLDIEGLLEVINNLQLEEYLDRLLDLPKSIVDAMNPAEILVEDGVISGVNETTWDDVLAEGKEHTTILERIADRIDVLINKVDDFFNPENKPPSDDNGTDWGNFKGFFDMFWIFYYLIIIAIILLVKFLAVVMSILNIPANTALFDSYPTILEGINYVKGLKVGGFDVTIQQIFEYMFMVFFFIFIVTTLQKLYHTYTGVERQIAREEKNIRIDSNEINKHYTDYSSFNRNIYNKEIYDNIKMKESKGPDEDYINLSDEEKFGRDG